MFLIKRENELDLAKLGKILSIFQTRDLPKLNKYYDYYLGKQKILTKKATDVGKPNNNIVVNYCSGIVSNYTGYLTGKDINYSSDLDTFDWVQDVLLYNDVHSADVELLRNACIFGRAVEMLWIDGDGKVRFKPIDPRECFAVYDDTLEQNLMYAIRFYSADYINDNTESYIVEVYDANKIRKYKSTPGFTSFQLIEETPHYFNQVPVTFFSLNKEETSIFDRVMTLQDAYNTLISSSIDDWESFCDAYLVLKGVIADEDDLTSMKKNRVLMVDQDADASYLTKNVTDTQIQNLLTEINDQIHVISLSPDFNDDRFMSASGIAMRYKLIGFENQAGSIEAEMKKALQRRLELICNILKIKGEEATWRDVVINFTRNLPVNEQDIAATVNSLRGLVSDETLLAQLPFVSDPAAEAERVKAQREESMSMYNFSALGSGESIDE